MFKRVISVEKGITKIITGRPPMNNNPAKILNILSLIINN
jgi:hypothetical protein